MQLEWYLFFLKISKIATSDVVSMETRRNMKKRNALATHSFWASWRISWFHSDLLLWVPTYFWYLSGIALNYTSIPLAHIHKLNSNSTSTHTPIRSVEVTLEEALSEWCSSIDLVFTFSTPPRLCGEDSSYTPGRLSSSKKFCRSQIMYNFRA